MKTSILTRNCIFRLVRQVCFSRNLSIKPAKCHCGTFPVLHIISTKLQIRPRFSTGSEFEIQKETAMHTLESSRVYGCVCPAVMAMWSVVSRQRSVDYRKWLRERERAERERDREYSLVTKLWVIHQCCLKQDSLTSNNYSSQFHTIFTTEILNFELVLKV